MGFRYRTSQEGICTPEIRNNIIDVVILTWYLMQMLVIGHATSLYITKATENRITAATVDKEVVKIALAAPVEAGAPDEVAGLPLAAALLFDEGLVEVWFAPW
jgi:hypothetical protein